MEGVNNGVIIGALTLTIVSTRFINISSSRVPPSFQPKKAAFAIWWIIFSFLLLTGLSVQTDDVVPTWLLVVAMLACSSWAFVSNTNLAVYSLLVGWAFASLSAFTFSLKYDQNQLVRVGPDLLAGWLTIAFALGVVTHANEEWNMEETAIVPLGFVLFCVSLSILSRSYVISLPLLWVAVFSKGLKYGIAFGTVGIVGTIVPLLYEKLL